MPRHSVGSFRSWPVRRVVLVFALPMLGLTGCAGTPPVEQLVDAEHLPGAPQTLVLSAGRTPDELRVMSANARVRTIFDLHNNWPNRRDLFAATVKRFGPDVLGAQECLSSQLRDLQRALPEYDHVAAGRNDGQTRGEMCPVFYKRDRFRKLDVGHFWLSDTPDRAGSRDWGAWFPRIVTWVKLERRDQPGATLYVFNTHFSVFARTARRNSAILLRERVAAIAGDAPALVLGDFNTTENTEPYRILTEGFDAESAPLRDTYRHVRPEISREENTIHNFRGGTRGRRIDWILASAPFDILDAAIDRTHLGGRYPSDHFPVQAVLRWPATATVAKPDRATDEEG